MSGFHEDERIRRKNRVCEEELLTAKPITLQIDDNVNLFEMIDNLTKHGYRIVINETKKDKTITIKK